MADIQQYKLAELFEDPAALYERLISRRGYFPKAPVIEFDAELATTGWTSLNCAILAVLVHHEQRAYIVMLDSVDISNLRAGIEQVQISLNQSSILNAGRGVGFGFGL
jgi:hypothetical protein